MSLEDPPKNVGTSEKVVFFELDFEVRFEHFKILNWIIRMNYIRVMQCICINSKCTNETDWWNILSKYERVHHIYGSINWKNPAEVASSLRGAVKGDGVWFPTVHQREPLQRCQVVDALESVTTSTFSFWPIVKTLGWSRTAAWDHDSQSNSCNNLLAI